MFTAAGSDDEAVKISEDVDSMRLLVGLDDEDWARRREVEIAARAGTADWTILVKLSMELDSAYNSSVIRHVALIRSIRPAPKV